MKDRPEYFGFTDVVKKLVSDKLSAVCLFIVAAYILLGIGFEAYSYYCIEKKISPVYEHSEFDKRFSPPGSNFIMGSDYAGRSVFLRALAGTSTAIKIGVVASVLSAVVGVTLGILGGYLGGFVDDIVVWIYSTFASMPTLLFILAFALLVSRGFLFPPLQSFIDFLNNNFHTDPGMLALYLGIGLTGWVSLCRVVRAEAMRIKQESYIQSAKTLGFGTFRIIIRHVLPNLFHVVIIYFTMRFAYAIMTEVIVSYLGLGVDMSPSWGKMISDGQQRLWRGIWWEVGFTTLFMFFLVLPLNLLGDSLRDILDPRLRQ